MEQCANCERTIGNMETPHIWRESIVCETCFKMLSPKDRTTSTPTPKITSQQLPPKSTDLNATRILLALGVVAGIVVILLLLNECSQRLEIINGRY